MLCHTGQCGPVVKVALLLANAFRSEEGVAV